MTKTRHKNTPPSSLKSTQDSGVKNSQKSGMKPSASKPGQKQPPLPAGRARKVASKKRAPIPWFWIALVGLVVVAVAGMVVYKLTYNPPVELEISAAKAHDKYLKGAFLLDVREQEEWTDYHIPGSTWIPLGELSSRVAEIPTDREVVVVCRSGNRSQEGRDILITAGFDGVSSMAGGLLEWRSAGYPIETGMTQ